MSALVGGSLLLIACSAAALLFGWAGQSEWLVGVSIVASVTSAIFLALAYHRSRTETFDPRS